MPWLLEDRVETQRWIVVGWRFAIAPYQNGHLAQNCSEMTFSRARFEFHRRMRRASNWNSKAVHIVSRTLRNLRRPQLDQGASHRFPIMFHVAACIFVPFCWRKAIPGGADSWDPKMAKRATEGHPCSSCLLCSLCRFICFPSSCLEFQDMSVQS